MDPDKEYEEQEILVYMDFSSKLDDDLLSLEKEFKLIGLESNTPILQLGNQVFQGEWKDSVGTQVMFEQDDNSPSADPAFGNDPPQFVKYACRTDKILHMSRIFVNSKKDPEPPSPEEPPLQTS